MHPHATQRRSLLYFGWKGFNVYLNNVDSPVIGHPIIGVFISEFKSKYHIKKFWADAVSCFKVTPQHSVNHFLGGCFDLDCFVVEFWDEKRIEPNCLYSVEIYTPTTHFFKLKLLPCLLIFCSTTGSLCLCSHLQ
jgi:hypothetical protein